MKKYAGIEAHIWGMEVFPGAPGRVLNSRQCNANGDSIYFMDFSENTDEPDCFFFDRYQNRVNIVLNIAHGQSTGFSDNDKSEIVELIKRGFVIKSGEDLCLQLPVFTEGQYEELLTLLKSVIDDVKEKVDKIINIFVDILMQHMPVSIKNNAAVFGMYKAVDCILVPIKIMLNNGLLHRATVNEHPTTYIVLK